MNLGSKLLAVELCTTLSSSGKCTLFKPETYSKNNFEGGEVSVEL